MSADSPLEGYSSLEKRSGIYESACRVLLGSLDGHAGRLPAITASSHEGLHISLCYLVPDHVAGVDVGTFPHLLAGRIVVQKLNYRTCDSGWVLEGNQRPSPIGQEFGGVPVRSRNDRLPGPQGIGQGS